MVELAKPRPGDTVLDPAAGEAGLLVEAARTTDGDVALVGQEVNESAWRMAEINLFLHDVDAALWHGNSLLEDAFPGLRADVVLCDPPFGLRKWGAERVAHDRVCRSVLRRRPTPIWPGFSTQFTTSDGGRACVVLPAGSLFRGGREGRIRTELVKRGAVEAIIGLPGGSAAGTQIPIMLWLLRRPDTSVREAPILIVDARARGTRGESRRAHPLSDDLIASISDAVETYRQGRDAFEGEPGFSTVVSTIELLAAETDLSPARWVESPVAAAAAEDVLEAIEAVRTQTADCERKFISGPVFRRPWDWSRQMRSPRWRISDLVDEGHVTVLRARGITRDDYRPSGTRVIMQRDLGGKTAPEEWRFVDVDELDRPPVLTQRGDVIMATIGEKPYAVVDEEGGLVLGGSLQVLRINVDWLDPVVVAALLGSSETARVQTSGAIKRVNLRDLAIPRLTHEECMRSASSSKALGALSA